MRTALVTGANRGIGWEVARQLAGAGYFVYVGCRTAESGERAAESLRADGRGDAAAIVLDVTDMESIRRAVAEVENRSESLDVLVNNAGILGERPVDGSPVPVDEIQRVFDTNFFGVVRVTRAFLPLLQKSSAPRIVNVTSELGSLTLQSDPAWSFSRFKSDTYPTSKAALNMYTVVLAAQLKNEGFKVNAVSPGYTATAFNNYSGEKKPEDAARPIVRYATLGPDGPTGGFFVEEGEVPW